MKRHKMPRSRPWACGVPVNVARHEGLPAGIAASAVGAVPALAASPPRRVSVHQAGGAGAARRVATDALRTRAEGPCSFSRRLTEVSNPLTT